MFRPTLVAEAKGDVVGELVVFEEQRNLPLREASVALGHTLGASSGGLGAGLIDVVFSREGLDFFGKFGVEGLVEVVGRSPSEDVIRAFSDDPFESHQSDVLGDLIGVDELSVAEDLGFDTEVLLHHFAVFVNLL